MIENKRAYQLIFSKTNSRLLAWLASCAAKTVGVCLSVCPRKREYISSDDKKAAEEKITDLWKRPPSSGEVRPLRAANGEAEVSVIVPAYNAEKYIAACVDSILGQKTTCRVELIVVNDGSTDKTGEYLNEYRERENVVIIDLENGKSAASARNAGLLRAVGKYVMFVDSDDVLLPGAIDALVRTAEKTGADVVQGGWCYMDESGNRGLTQQYADACYTAEHETERFELPGMPWAKLYDRRLFEDIRFPEGYTSFEDAIIHFLVFRAAKKPVSVRDIVYCWRKNPDGITNCSQSSARGLQSFWIARELVSLNERLGLSRDKAFRSCLVCQLSNFCYVNVAGLSHDVQTAVFTLCSDLFKNELGDEDFSDLPYAVRLGARSLKEGRFDLWVRQGRLFELIR